MATYLENLTTARDNAAARLAEVTAEKKPTYSVDGQLVSWTAYQSMLVTKLKELNDLIIQGDNTPFEIETQGFVQ